MRKHFADNICYSSWGMGVTQL